MKNKLILIGKNAKKAASIKISSKVKNKVLTDYCDILFKNKGLVIKENSKDIKLAIKKNLKENLISRLILNEKKILEIIKSLKEITKLKDPIDEILEQWKRPNGLNISKVTIPIGVIGVIYESRPNVTCDVAALCFKSGNPVILKGGSEALSSNKILSKLFRIALKKNRIDENFIQLIDIKKRSVVDYLLTKMKDYIDLIIPRGGKGLVKKVQQYSNIPIIGHLEGICHTYVDKDANLKMATKIIYNAKLRNTAICGATETILFHKQTLNKFLNPILKNLADNNCKIIADPIIKKKYKGFSIKATEKDWSTEYLSSAVSVKVVNNLEDAVNHINKYGTMHT
ncbi:MAG: glutamate-5-semialdehyde dehydrogenase, partial [Pelagibacteraceae bacterium]